MRTLLKILGVLFLVMWVGQAIQQTNNVNVRAIELTKETYPDAKIEYLSSDLSFFDVLFTKNHEWNARWSWDDERKMARWSRTYDQPIPLGIYFGMGDSWIRLIELTDF